MADSLRRRMMMGQGGSRLPDGYIELQYVQCAGQQYVMLNTSGIRTSNGWNIYVKYLGNGGSPYGMYNQAYNSKNELGVSIPGGAYTYIYYGRVSGYANASENWIPNVAISNADSSAWHTVQQTIDGVVFDGGALQGYSKNGGSYSYISTINEDYMGVGCQYNSTVGAAGVRSNSQFFGNLAYLKIGDAGGNVFYELIPALDVNSNIAGLYDLINDTFLTSEGTAFIAGPVK